MQRKGNFHALVSLIMSDILEKTLTAHPSSEEWCIKLLMIQTEHCFSFRWNMSWLLSCHKECKSCVCQVSLALTTVGRFWHLLTVDHFENMSGNSVITSGMIERDKQLKWTVAHLQLLGDVTSSFPLINIIRFPISIQFNSKRKNQKKEMKSVHVRML